MEEVLITCDNLSHVYPGGVVAVKEVNLKTSGES